MSRDNLRIFRLPREKKVADAGEFFAAYRKNTVFKKRKNGYEIKCRLGLWGVCGADLERVKEEAMHYYVQYFEDGEYSANRP